MTHPLLESSRKKLPLEKRLSQLDAQSQEIYEALGMSGDEVALFMKDRTRFAYDAWDFLEEQRARLSLFLNSARPTKKDKNY